MVNVEILEGLLEMVLSEGLFGVKASYQELGIIDVARAIGINDPHQETDPLLTHFFLYLEGLVKLGRLYDPIVVLVKLLKSLREELLFLACQELRDYVGVDDCLQLILKLYYM